MGHFILARPTKVSEVLHLDLEVKKQDHRCTNEGLAYCILENYIYT